MRIVSDYRWKQFKSMDKVPLSVLKKNFSHLGIDDDVKFLLYRGSWYHVSDFSYDNIFYWDGFYPLGVSYGVVIKVDHDRYMIGTYYN